MKKWMEKLVQQFDLDWSHSAQGETSQPMSEDRATLLFLLDVYNRHLLEMEAHPIRKTREILDEFSKELINPQNKDLEKVLFRLRQFLSGYRIDEYTYIQKTFDDFKGIIWDFVDQLSEDLFYEQLQDDEVQSSLEQLKEAVEANSIELLRTNARQFIDSYIELHSKKEVRRSKKIEHIQKSLHTVKKKLVEANHNMRMDHLTQAFNRKSFDEQMKQVHSLSRVSQQPATLIMMDIDYFKRINDSYGHAMGDFILIECVKLLKEMFRRDADFVARVGGEEFAVILPDYNLEQAQAKIEEVLKKVRSEVYVNENMQLKFTMSAGIAQLQKEESIETWIQRADAALYKAKNNGRDQFCLASTKANIKVA